MMQSRCAQCRRANVKLFLKGERCFSTKCGVTRRPTVPGVHGNAKRRRNLSEYGLQLQEKQKLQRTYGLRERQFKIYVKRSLDKKGVSAEILMQELESRLDNTVFKLGLANSRSQARQLVVHGFIKVNKRKVDRPSYQVKEGDIIFINEVKLKKPAVEAMRKEIAKYNAPDWLNLNKEELRGTVKKMPIIDQADSGVDLQRIIEFYSSR